MFSYIRHEPEEALRAVREVGNVTLTSEITFEYGMRKQTVVKKRTQPARLSSPMKKPLLSAVIEKTGRRISIVSEILVKCEMLWCRYDLRSCVSYCFILVKTFSLESNQRILAVFNKNMVLIKLIFIDILS